MSEMTRAGAIYLTLTLTAAFSILSVTLWLYISYDRGVPETFSAAVVNTAATLAAATFVGVFDMFFTIQQLRKNEEDRKQWQAELEKARKEADTRREEQQAEAQKQRAEAQQERAEAQKQRAEADARIERLLDEFRNEREQARVREEQARVREEQARVREEQAQIRQEQNQQMIADLLARNMELNARLMDLLERRNGSGNDNGSGEHAG